MVVYICFLIFCINDGTQWCILHNALCSLCTLSADSSLHGHRQEQYQSSSETHNSLGGCSTLMKFNLRPYPGNLRTHPRHSCSKCTTLKHYWCQSFETYCCKIHSTSCNILKPRRTSCRIWASWPWTAVWIYSRCKGLSDYRELAVLHGNSLHDCTCDTESKVLQLQASVSLAKSIGSQHK
jgi:hypothetical protein